MNLPVSRLPALAVAAAILAGLVVGQAGCGCSKSPQVKGSKYMNDGQDAVAKGHIRRAIVCFEKEIELNPKNPDPYLKLALIYEHLREDPAKASRYYEQYFKTETNKTKLQRVKRWQAQLEEESGPLESPTSPNGARPEMTDAALVEQLADAQRELREAQASNDEFAKRIIELEGIQDKLDAAQAAQAQLTKERDELKAQAQTKTQSLAALQKTYNELKAEYDELKGAEETASQSEADEIARLKASVADLETRNGELETRNAELEAERSRAGRRSLAKKLDAARDSLKAAEKKNAEYARRIEELEKTIAQLKPGSDVPPRTTTHVVQEGETLRTISLRYYGTKDRWQDIYRANRNIIANPDEIKAGQELIIPLDDSP